MLSTFHPSTGDATSGATSQVLSFSYVFFLLVIRYFMLGQWQYSIVSNILPYLAYWWMICYYDMSSQIFNSIASITLTYIVLLMHHNRWKRFRLCNAIPSTSSYYVGYLYACDTILLDLKKKYDYIPHRGTCMWFMLLLPLAYVTVNPMDRRYPVFCYHHGPPFFLSKSGEWVKGCLWLL